MSEQIELNNNLYTHFSRGLVFLPPEMRGLLVLLKVLFEEFLIWCTRPVEVFFRCKFGVRSHSLFQTAQICGAAFCLSVLLIASDRVLVTFGFLSAGLSIYHLIEAQLWEKRRSPPRYSYSNGEPMPWWGFGIRCLQSAGFDLGGLPRTEFFCLFAEPLGCLLAAAAVYPYSKSLCVYLCCCAVALFLKGLIVRQRIINMRRDQVDARILSTWLIGVQRAAAGKGEQQKYVVSLPNPVLRQTEDVELVTRDPESPEPAPELPEAETEDFIRFNCGNCGRGCRVLAKYRGRQGKCKECRHSIVVA